ncbi:hypothetical protein NP493_892g03014 [Ridgeia piscesae]|uniref:Uncharacterized protein n=1 Tax=Ridgeia piscesae TaxID=27915 RepID=A0AAD9NK25_RIDPI|nr:hypothetical protein NP493_892g03014 [Ridgeia piscesae]
MSEYCDDVAKLNKKEDMLLARKLRVLDRQERVAQNIFRRTIHEAERLQVAARTKQKRPDLQQFEYARQMARNSRYGGSEPSVRERSNRYPTNPPTRLPPLVGNKLTTREKIRGKKYISLVLPQTSNDATRTTEIHYQHGLNMKLPKPE